MPLLPEGSGVGRPGGSKENGPPGTPKRRRREINGPGGRASPGRGLEAGRHLRRRRREDPLRPAPPREGAAVGAGPGRSQSRGGARPGGANPGAGPSPGAGLGGGSGRVPRPAPLGDLTPPGSCSGPAASRLGEPSEVGPKPERNLQERETPPSRQASLGDPPSPSPHGPDGPGRGQQQRPHPAGPVPRPLLPQRLGGAALCAPPGPGNPTVPRLEPHGLLGEHRGQGGGLVLRAAARGPEHGWGPGQEGLLERPARLGDQLAPRAEGHPRRGGGGHGPGPAAGRPLRGAAGQQQRVVGLGHWAGEAVPPEQGVRGPPVPARAPGRAAGGAGEAAGDSGHGGGDSGLRYRGHLPGASLPRTEGQDPLPGRQRCLGPVPGPHQLPGQTKSGATLPPAPEPPVRAPSPGGYPAGPGVCSALALRHEALPALPVTLWYHRFGGLDAPPPPGCCWFDQLLKTSEAGPLAPTQARGS